MIYHRESQIRLSTCYVLVDRFDMTRRRFMNICHIQYVCMKDQKHLLFFLYNELYT